MRSSHVSPLRLGAFCVVVLALFAGGCSGSDDDSGASADSPPASAEGAMSAGCESVHAGHSAMMWNPVMADEMLDEDCGWPYDPFLVTLDGGEDDSELTAAFEPLRYDELWSAVSSSGVGVCSVGTELEGDGVGRAFGFTYLLGPPGCPEATSTGALHVAEFGTEAQRDAAALAAVEPGSDTFVLGRWVVVLDGDVGDIAASLVDLGAQQV